MLRPTAVLTALVALALPLAAAPARAADPEPSAPAVRTVSTPAAAHALAAARRLGAPGSRDATLVLRNLNLHRAGLSPADRAVAARLLARPATTRSQCYDTVCVHWYASGKNAAKPAYVAQVATTAQSVLATYAAAGYRAPEPDGTKGGNAKLDIYLQDLGSQGLYGYCTSDDPPSSKGPYDAPAYCAFDNNYSEFPTHTPLENLQVTAAHEIFHAVQFAYDYYEDSWFMEATATWAEDELYDNVNDNLQYLPESPLAQPGKSMDHFERTGVRQYGDWIFFRYLTEQDPAAAGGLPTLIRDMWERADGAAGGPNDYSMQAVQRVLADRSDDLSAVWAQFAAANRRPGSTYEEGQANGYPSARLDRKITISGAQPDSGWVARSIDHLAASTVGFTRAPALSAKTLKLTLDLPPTKRGSAVVATVYSNTGDPVVTPITLNAAGDATMSVPFGSTVTSVEVSLANAGIDYSGCYRGTAWSCQGTPLDDNLRFKVRASALS